MIRIHEDCFILLRFDEILFSSDHDWSNAVALIGGLCLNFCIDIFQDSIRKFAGKV